MLLWFYRLPLWFVVLCTFLFVIFYAKLSEVFYRKQLTKSLFRLFNSVMLIFSLFLIAYATVINRNQTVRDLILQPFQSFIEAKIQPEMYRTMWMNVVLFVPFGVTFSNLFSEKNTVISIILSLIFGLSISVLIEYVQYTLSIGLTQTDDVLCNTVGALIGYSSILTKKYFRYRTVNQYYFE